MYFLAFLQLLILADLLNAAPPKNDDFEFLAGEEDETDREEASLEKDILVIPNHFPKRLNWFCNPRHDLQRDRFCFAEIDAYALACADDNPPIQLVPFCMGYKHQCSHTNYPSDEWCEREFEKYDRFCTRCSKNPCTSSTHDISCSCEPYEELWRRFGLETARWCQKYELLCDEKSRREKGTELVELMHDKIKVHYRCLHLFNLPPVICNPFSARFDWYRCMKFVFDCELISDWEEEEDYEEVGVVDEKQSSEPRGAAADLSENVESILKGGVSQKQLNENAETRHKVKELATVLEKPAN